MRFLRSAPAMGLALCIGAAPAARAEVSEVLLGQQIGATYLPALVMESHKLVEKKLEAFDRFSGSLGYMCSPSVSLSHQV